MENTPVLLGILSNLENNLVGNLDGTNSLDATITIPQVIGEQYVLPPATRKVNGSWVEQSDLTQVFDPTKNYVRGINNGL